MTMYMPFAEVAEKHLKSHKGNDSTLNELDARLGAAKGKLIYQAARCLSVLPLSEFAEDWPVAMPESAIREIEKQTERLRDMAVALRNIADSI